MSTATSAPPQNPPSGPDVRSGRLVATLGSAGALAGLLIVGAYQLTLPAIEANRAARLDNAIHQVLQGIDRYDTLYLLDGSLTATLPPTVDGKKLPKLYAGLDESGTRSGFAIPASEPGFQDSIEILFGFDPATRTTRGLVILASRETPGLGDKILGESFLTQFRTAKTPLVGVKAGNAATPNDVAMITGATISSRTVIAAINKAVERWAPLVDAYVAGAGS